MCVGYITKVSLACLSFFFLFSTSSFGQVFDSVPDITLQATEFYKSSNQKEVKHKLVSPSALVVASSGNVYVFDDGNSRIVKLDKNGRFLIEFGFPGSGNGQITRGGLNSSIAVDQSENVYVADAVNPKIQIFDSNGSYLRSFRVPFAIDSIAVNKLGEILVSVSSSKNIPLVYVFSNTGKFLRTLGERIVTTEGNLPKEINRNVISVDAQNNISICFRNWSLIRKYSRSGKLLGENSYKIPPSLVSESQRSNYKLEFISKYPNTSFVLPLLAHSISASENGEEYVLLNGHSIVKSNLSAQIIKQGSFQKSPIFRNAVFVRLATGTSGNFYLLDIKSSSIFKIASI